jgi:hypothetical protein
MTTARTGQPWKISEERVTEIKCHKGFLRRIETAETAICWVESHPAGCKIPEQEATGEANARLIAAAPQLREALQAILNHAPLSQNLFDQARAALAASE